MGVCEFCGRSDILTRHYWCEDGLVLEAGVCSSCSTRLGISAKLAGVFGGNLPPRRVQEIYVRSGGDLTQLFEEIERELGRHLSYSVGSLIGGKKLSDRDTVEFALSILARFRRRVSRLDYFGLIPQESSVKVLGQILEVEKELDSDR